MCSSSNNCNYCRDKKIGNYVEVDTNWFRKNNDCWPKPFMRENIKPQEVKGIIVGQDPTIENQRQIEYVLEANNPNSKLGHFLREIFTLVPNMTFDEIYVTNLVKCRFKEKPGKGGRNVSQFLKDMARQCYSRFLRSELVAFKNAKYIFTLGMDTYLLTSELLKAKRPTGDFKDFYGEPIEIPESGFGSQRYLVPLPHQPTYELANRYSYYAKPILHGKLKKLSSE